MDMGTDSSSPVSIAWPFFQDVPRRAGQSQKRGVSPRSGMARCPHGSLILRASTALRALLISPRTRQNLLPKLCRAQYVENSGLGEDSLRWRGRVWGL